MLAVAACAPFQRVALKRCPTTIASLADFTAATVLLGAGMLAYNGDRDARALTLTGTAMIWAVASNESECSR